MAASFFSTPIATTPAIDDELEYKVLFVDEKLLPLLNDISCSICTYPWIDPVGTPCNHIYCRACISRWLGTKRKCALCRGTASLDTLRSLALVNPSLYRQLATAAYRCPVFADYGCAWQGSYFERHHHIATDCLYHLVACRLCGTKIVRGQLSSHEATCGSSSVQCPYCATYMAMSEKQFHLVHRCDGIPRPCSTTLYDGGGCGKPVSRRDHTHHLATVCTKVLLSCSHVDMGCLWRGTRDTAAAHTRDAATRHLHLATEAFAEYKRRTDAEIQQLRQTITWRDARIAELSRNNGATPAAALQPPSMVRQLSNSQQHQHQGLLNPWNSNVSSTNGSIWAPPSMTPLLPAAAMPRPVVSPIVPSSAVAAVTTNGTPSINLVASWNNTSSPSSSSSHSTPLPSWATSSPAVTTFAWNTQSIVTSTVASSTSSSQWATSTSVTPTSSPSGGVSPWDYRPTLPPLPSSSAATPSPPPADSSALSRVVLRIGDIVDCCDTTNKWYHVQIMDIRDDNLYLHFLGWPDAWNEWLPRSSPRLAPKDSHSSGPRLPTVYQPPWSFTAPL